MPSATIRFFLVNGDAKRLRTAELFNWSGKAVAGPRSEFDSVIAREEAQQSGVYFLTGTDPESGKPTIYIGEAECIKCRLKNPRIRLPSIAAKGINGKTHFPMGRLFMQDTLDYVLAGGAQ